MLMRLRSLAHFFLLFLCVLAWLPAHAVAVKEIERETYDRSRSTVDLRGDLEYALVPAGAVDPDGVWQQPEQGFKRMQGNQRLRIPEGMMLLARIELRVEQVRDPDYLRLPSSRLDRVRYWGRAEGYAWRDYESGDRVAMSSWPFSGTSPAFELPSANGRLQIVLAIEHRGSLNVPIQWVPDHVFRAEHMNHAYAFGALSGLALTLAGVCLLAAALFRRVEFLGLCGYTLVTGLGFMASNGYAAIYLWPDLPTWNDPSKTFLAMVLTSLLLPVVAMVLRLDVHRHTWWRASWAWAAAGLVYAELQRSLLPPEWRIAGSLVHVILSLGFAGALALHGVRRGDAMSRWTLLAVLSIAMATALAYADFFDIVNELSVLVANATLRLVFIVLMLGIAVQRFRFGRDVLSRQMVGEKRDALTGLRTRAGLQQEVARSALLSDASEHEAGIILCDLRSIGTLRSEYGEETCERVLVRVAYVLQNSLRQGDVLLGRLGYGRFGIVLLRGATEEAMQALATRILSRLLAQTDLPDAVRELKVRIAMAREPLASLRLDAVEVQMNRVVPASGDSRTIRWL